MDKIISIINIVVLALTLIAIVWYTVETFRLRKINEKQIRINIMPLIAVVNIGNEIKLKNIGKSPALNVTINSIKNRTCGGSKDKFDFIVAESIPFLDVGGEKQIQIKPKPLPPTTHQNPNPDPFLNPSNPNFQGEYILIINCEDIENSKIQLLINICKKGIILKEAKWLSKKAIQPTFTVA